MTHPKWKFDGVRVVHSNELDINTPQTPGTDRAAATACARRGGKAMGRNGGDSPQGEDRRPPPRARRERHLCSERKGTHALGREPRVHGRGRAGDFIYVPPYVPHQEINASDTEPLSCVLCRSGREPVVVNLPDLPVAEKPEEVRWVDDSTRDSYFGASRPTVAPCRRRRP